ncbi:MAG: hypothetical protein FJ086_09825 [Deltaproteobacteria bacterium]|nr:hypothetical protein [Deltaproteobacteria bacterium]
MPRLRAALISDDRVVALLATRALQDAFDVQTFQTFQTTSESFAGAVAEAAPAVLLVCGVLAVGTGVDALKRLRADPRLAATPVVALCSPPAPPESWTPTRASSRASSTRPTPGA